ncbi:MAG: protein-export chaperone SecB [Verrucomicrobiales bacterium]|nr:protein-export chaperone SecB [Verrucomicrobiota bacterium JB025]
MISPIQTRRHWIRQIAFEPGERLIKNSKYNAQFSLSVEQREKHSWHVVLSVKFDASPPEEATFKGRFDYEGVFDIHPDFPEEKAPDLVRMNGGAILYGAIREQVLNLTSRSKHGPFEMPTIDARMFLEKPKPKKKAKTKTAGKKTAKKATKR